MENSYNALIFAACILLFMIAVSVGIYSYSTLMNANKSILTDSEYNDRDAENFALTMFAEDTTRKYTGAEVAMQIINMYEGKDVSFSKIVVSGGPGAGTFPTGSEKLQKIADDDTGVNQNYNKYVIAHADQLRKISLNANPNEEGEQTSYYIAELNYTASGGVQVTYQYRVGS